MSRKHFPPSSPATRISPHAFYAVKAYSSDKPNSRSHKLILSLVCFQTPNVANITSSLCAPIWSAARSSATVGGSTRSSQVHLGRWTKNTSNASRLTTLRSRKVQQACTVTFWIAAHSAERRDTQLILLGTNPD